MSFIPKSKKPLNSLKESLKSLSIFSEFPFKGQGKDVENLNSVFSRPENLH